MQTVEYTMSVPKETKEIIDAVSGLLQNFVDGHGLQGAASHLPAIMAAIDGFAGVGDELKSQYKDEAAGYLVHKLWGSLNKAPASA